MTTPARALVDELAGERPLAAALARCVALAVRVEPELLRAVRLRLLPDATAADEADLWFSDLVEAEGAFGITFTPDVRELLRLDLATRQDELHRTWAVLEDVHRALPPAVQVEERLAYLALSDRPERLAEIERELHAVALAMGDSRRRGLARWAAGALPALPEAARESAAAWTLAAGAGARLGGRTILRGRPPDSLTPEALSWALPRNGPHHVIALRLHEQAVEFGPPGPGDTHVIPLPMPEPLLVRVAWLAGDEVRSERVVLRSTQRTVVPAATAAGVLITTASGRRYNLRPGARAGRTPLVYLAHAAGEPEAQTRVDVLRDRLESAGFEAWVDRTRLQPGDRWREEIDSAMGRADAAVVILSPAALESEWLLKEISVLAWRGGLDEDWPLIPVLVGVDAAVLGSSRLAATGIADREALAGDDPEELARQVVARLAGLHARDWSEAGDPVEAQWLPGDRPFLDRVGLRQAVREMMSETGPRILVVNGPRGSGKSFTLRFIAHVAESTGAFRVVSVAAAPAAAAPYSATELAESLALQMGRSTGSPPEPSGQPARRAPVLADWLLRLAREDAGIWWWVLDGFSSAMLAEDTRHLVAGLAQRVDDVSGGVRLILLGYDEPLPARVARSASYEELTTIEEVDVRKFVEDLLARSEVEERPAAAEDLVANLLAGLPSGPEWLEELSARLHRVSRQLPESQHA